MTNTNQSHRSQGPTAGTRLRALLLKRTIFRDVVQGILAGGVLAFFTAILVINVEDHAIQTTVNGWSTTLQCGKPGSGILLRAACANGVAALNLPEQEVYWTTFVDGAGHRLNGQHDYILHFPPGGLPPNNAAWSVTMGDSRRRMVDNPLHRYSIGGRSGLAPNADGSIDIYIQNTVPAVHESNWLPAPAAKFMLWLRVYQPGAAILIGTYQVPSVVEVKGGRK
jgi:hypothetical protein